MALLAYALTTLENVKESLSITDSDNDSLLERLINAATELIESETGRRFKKTDHEEEIHDGIGKNLALENYPILDSEDDVSNSDPVIKRIYSDGTDDTIDEDSYRYNKKTGVIYRAVGWPEGEDNISVDYTAGYDTIPADLEQACIDLVSYAYNRRKNAGVKSEADGAYSITYATLDQVPTAKATISLYTRYDS